MHAWPNGKQKPHTHVYHEALAKFLAGAGYKVSVVNPFLVKKLAESHGFRIKTDPRDGLVLALFGHERQLQAWSPPIFPEVKPLKALLARLTALETDIRRELNRPEKAQVSGVPMKEKSGIQKEINDHFDRHPKFKEERESASPFCLAIECRFIENQKKPFTQNYLQARQF